MKIPLHVLTVHIIKMIKRLRKIKKGSMRFLKHCHVLTNLDLRTKSVSTSFIVLDITRICKHILLHHIEYSF